MPYRTSSEASETDALRVVDALGCRTERVDITPMVEPMLELIDRRRTQAAAQRAPRQRHGAPADDRALRPLGRVRRARHRHVATRPRRCSATGPCTATWPPPSRRSATCTRPSCARSPTELGVPRGDPRQAAVGRPVARPDRRGRARPHATTCSTARSSPSSTGAGRSTDASPPASTAHWSSGSPDGSRGWSSSASRRRSPSSRCARPASTISTRDGVPDRGGKRQR